MTKSIKIKIRLTHDQESLCNQIFGSLRYVYNKYLEVNKDFYDIEKGFCSAYLFDQMWNHSLKPDWFTLKATKAVKETERNAEKAFKRFFKHQSGFPKKKRLHDPVQSFFFIKYGIRFNEDKSKIWISNLHWIKLCEKNYLKEDMIPYITSGRIIRNSGGYFVSFILKDYPSKVKFIDDLDNSFMDGIGIDLGIKTYATIASTSFSSAMVGNPINTNRYKILDYWIDKYNQAISNKVNWNFKSHGYDISKGYPRKLKKGEAAEIYRSKSILKLRKRIQKLNYQKQCIMEDHIKKLCTSLVRTKPEYVTIEDLSNQSMSQSKFSTLNKHLTESRFRYFRDFLTWKCKEYGIELRIADKAFPSSRICSCCGHVKKKPLALSTRIYSCKKCGFEIDRDLNAAINLAKCKEFTLAV